MRASAHHRPPIARKLLASLTKQGPTKRARISEEADFHRDRNTNGRDDPCPSSYVKLAVSVYSIKKWMGRVVIGWFLGLMGFGERLGCAIALVSLVRRMSYEYVNKHSTG